MIGYRGVQFKVKDKHSSNDLYAPKVELNAKEINLRVAVDAYK